MYIKINNKKIECRESQTVYEVAKKNQIYIPVLCYQKSLLPESRCRICMVEIDGVLLPSCSTQAKQGMVVKTSTDEVLKYRKINTELMAASHAYECFVEEKEHELSRLIKNVGLREIRFEGKKHHKPSNKSSIILQDNNKCIVCARCVRTCDEIQTVTALGIAHKRYHIKVTPYYDRELSEVACVKCGQCIINCPVGAIYERNDVDAVIKALESGKHVIAQTAPSIRVSLGEIFNLEPGTIVTGKMVAALKKAGFTKVFDTNLGADLTIIEEAHELLERIKKKKLPLITSCSPGWINFIEYFYPELLPYLSTCKSPHQMLGALIKTYYAKKLNINSKDIIVVSIMPCTAKKFESERPEMKIDGMPAVDYVLTTREAGALIKKKKIDFISLEDGEFDNVLGISTGAGALFGATGGVMEAALRTVYELITKKEIKHLDFTEVRGAKGIREASIYINNDRINVAVAHGLGNARILLEKIKQGKADYHFIEMMACPGGCIGGGGQPIPTDSDIIKKRAEALYQQDKNMLLRKSHENPVVKEIYKKFLGKPLGKKSRELLHTKYTKRRIYQ